MERLGRRKAPLTFYVADHPKAIEWYTQHVGSPPVYHDQSLALFEVGDEQLLLINSKIRSRAQNTDRERSEECCLAG